LVKQKCSENKTKGKNLQAGTVRVWLANTWVEAFHVLCMKHMLFVSKNRIKTGTNKLRSKN